MAPTKMQYALMVLVVAYLMDDSCWAVSAVRRGRSQVRERRFRKRHDLKASLGATGIPSSAAVVPESLMIVSSSARSANKEAAVPSSGLRRDSASALAPHGFAASSLDTRAQTTNPWLEGELKAFIDKFNIPRAHGSGVYVDLGKTGAGYRQAGGECPVFGKYIKLLKVGATTETFLEDYPAGGSSSRPLPGGFNLSYVSGSGRSFSPVQDSYIHSVLADAGPQTAIARCARYAYLLDPLKPGTNTPLSYKMPFVYNMTTQECYVLHVSMQKLSGSRYCSTNGSPSGLTWPCFYPEKNHKTSTHLVYGSGYMGASSADPDAWETKCPNKAVRDALFGQWVNDSCEPFSAGSGDRVQTFEVSSKEQCWERVFQESASDEAVATNPANWDSIWPTLDSSASTSGGVGSNYANFYPKPSGGTCVIISSLPTCFVRSTGSIAYNAIGALDEEELPTSAGGGGEGGGGGGDGSGGGNGSESEGGNTWAIAGGVVGGLLILGAIGGGAAYYKSRHGKPEPSGSPADRDVDHGVGGAAGRSATEANVQLEESFWRDENGGLIDTDYDK